MHRPLRIDLRPRPAWYVEAFLLILHCLKFILQPSKYPLFSLHRAGGGLIGWIRSGKRLGLSRQASFRGRVHYAPIVPGLPSHAFDRLAGGGGMNLDDAGTRWKPGIDLAILAIARRCPLACTHCYARSTTGSDETVPVEVWIDTVSSLQQIGTGIIALSGGEPMMRFDDLLSILGHADMRASEFHLHTSGMGVTPERARVLARAGITAAGIGLDDVNEERHDRLRGYRGAYRQAHRAVGMFREAGILPYLNMCLTHELVRSGDLWSYFEMAKDLNVAFIQMLEPRPAGRLLDLGEEPLLAPEDRAAVMRFFTASQDNHLYARYPIVYYVAHTEHPEVMGCRMGGLSHLSVDGDGNVTPCVFLPVTFGNIRTECFDAIYARMRAAIPTLVRATCPSIVLGPCIREACACGADIPVPFERIPAAFSGAVNGTLVHPGSLLHDPVRRTS